MDCYPGNTMNFYGSQQHYHLLETRITELDSFFGALPVHNGGWFAGFSRLRPGFNPISFVDNASLERQCSPCSWRSNSQ